MPAATRRSRATVHRLPFATALSSHTHLPRCQAGATNYDYAMLVNENINVNAKCDLMPATDHVTFTKVSVNGKAAVPWTTRANCKGNPKCDCGNEAAVGSNGDVTLSWKPS